jgi:hypothetical protein
MHGGQPGAWGIGLALWIKFGSTGSLFTTSDAAALTCSVEGSRNLDETNQSGNTIVMDALPAANTI